MQKIFGQLGFVEQTGHGVPLIVDIYGKESFEIMDNFINVTIPFTELKKTEKSFELTEKDKLLLEELVLILKFIICLLKLLLFIKSHPKIKYEYI